MCVTHCGRHALYGPMFHTLFFPWVSSIWGRNERYADVALLLIRHHVGCITLNVHLPVVYNKRRLHERSEVQVEFVVTREVYVPPVSLCVTERCLSHSLI